MSGSGFLAFGFVLLVLAYFAYRQRARAVFVKGESPRRVTRTALLVALAGVAFVVAGAVIMAS